MPSRALDPNQGARRRRSRSPSAMLKSGSKSIRGLIKKGKKKKTTNKAKQDDISSKITATPASAVVPKKEENEAPAALVAEDYEEEETVYNVEIDNKASVSAIETRPSSSSIKITKEGQAQAQAQAAPIEIAQSSNANPPPLLVVLLLMDSKTRRFELIQLAFDAELATVKDVLGQISSSATEQALKTQVYENVCSVNGTEPIAKEILLKTCFKTLDSRQENILLAVPTGMDVHVCKKLAVPILNDPKVKAMLSPPPAPVAETPALPPPPPVEEEPVEEKIEEVKASVSAPAAVVTSTSRSVPTIDITSKAIEEEKEPDETSSSTSSGSTLSLLLVLIAVFIPILGYVQTRITSPLAPGDVLYAGHWRSKCGLIPTSTDYLCSSDSQMYLELSSSSSSCVLTVTSQGDDDEGNDSIVVLYQAEGTSGGECTSVSITEAGVIQMDGKDAKVVINTPAGVDITPWPFTIQPTNKAGKKGRGRR